MHIINIKQRPRRARARARVCVFCMPFGGWRFYFIKKKKTIHIHSWTDGLEANGELRFLLFAGRLVSVSGGVGACMRVSEEDERCTAVSSAISVRPHCRCRRSPRNNTRRILHQL